MKGKKKSDAPETFVGASDYLQTCLGLTALRSVSSFDGQQRALRAIPANRTLNVARDPTLRCAPPEGHVTFA